MSNDARTELYQQVILEHNKNPRNFKKLEPSTHNAEGYNPLCGDHLHVYLNMDSNNTVSEVTFEGDGCAISKASASMMTESLKGATQETAEKLIKEFNLLITGKLDPDKDTHSLGKLAIFSGIWHFPARVKCASLCWHTVKAAFDNESEPVKTE